MLGDLERFRDLATAGDADGRRLSSNREVMDALAPAERAMAVVGVTIATAPPGGGQLVHGLMNTLVGSMHFRASWNEIEGFVNAANGLLKEAIVIETRRRHRPTYWIDRVLRAVLGVPAYLIGIVVGKPKKQIDESKGGAWLRGLTAVSSIAGIVAVLHGFGFV
jgi:hypothetical protein